MQRSLPELTCICRLFLGGREGYCSVPACAAWGFTDYQVSNAKEQKWPCLATVVECLASQGSVGGNQGTEKV